MENNPDISLNIGQDVGQDIGQTAQGQAITVQLCYARSGLQILQALQLPPGSTIAVALENSGIAQQMPEIDFATCKVGIFSKLKQMDTVLRDGDRVEIYRPLLADPKIARRERAEQKRAGRKFMSA